MAPCPVHMLSFIFYHIPVKSVGGKQNLFQNVPTPRTMKLWYMTKSRSSKDMS
ncbi:phosphatidylinositol-4-phosphate 3-kinase catalytic subunit type 2 gamma [Phyllostomus discolor]|uniref:Phosphatidylinositol-4-phosphate 3-kinase catalytic subunit type 2 gamma n=1 Tax=Phyllostomus discolor TaxID=89673 RepID=A0A834B1P8_9CHIR|nr:phosphatidylinositol-4-phosphate 3-kinase catalytic subunit type 2 gamma [Phyllostomus discolor]